MIKRLGKTILESGSTNRVRPDQDLGGKSARPIGNVSVLNKTGLCQLRADSGL